MLLAKNLSANWLNRQGTLALPDYTTAQMDEQSGALDALTRERMASELLHIWQKRCKMVTMVTHDIGEAVYLADRAMALSDRPAKITLDLKIDLLSCTVLRCATPRSFGRLS